LALELYSTSTCPYCAEVREEFEWRERVFVEYDVSFDAEARARLIALTGGTLVPVVVEDGAVRSVGWKGRGCNV
jgi:glutaredoxin